ncbi:Cytochrome P450 86A1 [Monoraphidium neglectum]|uniref:Cytochrome P450 86A1 n=1 Tax=Monoraphidium neglectum TaxID=145388 RepID=A0A0D2MQJ5_9CHLO|nr:Cytochrome P450 86A1 [Monoraphidium neglectum]KIY96920.1 Cytochrome P450 86A1 [Monoraphidium neglectum]|eukprot:XP_013895940.1 Cytochrome P450 86A1 [Monoraphidium neglectum]
MSFKQYVSEVFSAKADLLLARLAAACPPGPTATAAADCAPSNASVPSAVRAGSAAGPEVGAVCGGAAAAAALGVVPGEAIDIQDVFYRFTLDAFCHIGFGTDPGCLSAAGRLPFAAAFDRAQRTTITRFWVPCWRLREALDGRGRQLRRDVATIRAFAAAIIAQRRSALETTRAATQPQPQPEQDDDADEISQLQRAEVGGGSCGAASCDLLDLFMSEEGPDGAPLGDAALIDAVLNFIIAGRDTTAQALSWTLYEVMRHPEVESKILSEAEAVLGPLRRPRPADTNPRPAPAPSGPPGGDPTCAPAAGGVGQGGGGAGGEAAAAPLSYERLQALRYARAVFLEGLRLHPSVPQDVKFALCSDVLPCGTRVPAGAMVLYSAYAINRMMEFWGPDADEFR